MPFTNRGLLRVLDCALRGAAPANLHVALVTATTAPSPTTNTLGDLQEIAAGNGYTAGGVTIARDAVDWDVLTEDDGAGRAFAQMKNVVLTASGGPIPASGGAARSVVLLGPHATPASREVWAYWTEGAGFTIPSGQSLTIIDYELALEQPA